jgi:arginyl-tRNA synthetase
MVQLLRNGEPVKMSKRSGNFVTLADVVSEVGKDVVRFTMLTRKPEAQMDFDFAKVVEASKDNPVFYVQYAMPASARRCARPRPRASRRPSADLELLGDEELELVKLAAQFPRLVEARPPRASRTASPSSSATSPRRSTPTGTSATTARKAVHRGA